MNSSEQNSELLPSDSITQSNMLAEVCQHKNALMKLNDKMRHQEFKVGDKVRVVDYVVWDEYKVFEGVVTRDKTGYRPIDGYEYSVKVEGLDRTEFDASEMEAI